MEIIVKLTIHRGTHQIGGYCVELGTETTRIIADIGMPLEKVDRKSKYTPAQLLERKILPDVKGLYYWDKNTKTVKEALLWRNQTVENPAVLM